VPDPILSIRNLVVEFKTDDGIVHAVDDISYDVIRARLSASSASPAPARASARCRSSGSFLSRRVASPAETAMSRAAT